MLSTIPSSTSTQPKILSMSSIQTQIEESKQTSDARKPSESKKSKGLNKESEAETEVGRERLKRHRAEMSGRVWIPEMWGQEDLLKEWIDCAAFDASLVSSTILMARDSLASQGRRAATSTPLRIQN